MPFWMNAGKSMSQKSDLIRVRHMAEAAEKVITFSSGSNRSALDSDEKLALALVRLVEIIGEAASKVTNKTQSAHPEIPWADIVGTRNRLIHGYEQVDLDIVWQIVSTDVPLLLPGLKRIIHSLSQQDDFWSH
jgi:uncharacterized protein with HEPN domain